MKSHLVFLNFLLIPFSSLSNVITVTTEVDEFDTPSGADVSLREAIRDAGTSAATICFDASLSGETFSLTMGRLLVTGLGQGKITIDGSSLAAPPVLDGNSDDIVIQTGSRDLELVDVVVTGGYTESFEGAITCGNGNLTLREVKVRQNVGPAVYVSASHPTTLTTASLEAYDCEFYENHIVGTSLLAGSPVSIAMGCVMVVSDREGEASGLLERCALYHNSARNRSGVIGVHRSEVVVRNTTLAENSAPTGSLFPVENAGAIRVTSDGEVSVENCTIVDNLQYGIVGVGQVELRESIIARNKLMIASFAASSFSGSPSAFTSLGGNLSNENHSILDHPFDQGGVDPRLSRLGYHGGKVLTCYPLADSPAIDGGDPNRAPATPLTDARGFVRLASSAGAPTANTIDCGAVEIRSNEDLVVVNSASGGAGSLRQALSAVGSAASESGRRILFSPTLSGQTIRLSSALVRDELTNHHVDIDASNLPEGIILGTSVDDDIMRVTGGNDLSLHHVKFSGFRTSSTNLNQGLNPLRILGDASVGLNGVVMEKNSGPFGGGIQTRSSGRLHVNRCLFSENTASSFSGNSIRAGQDADGCLVQVWNSAFVDNSALSIASGAISVQGFENRLEVRNSLFSGNESVAVGSALQISGCSGRVSFSTFAENSANKGAIRLENNRVDISDCLFKDNVSTTKGDAENDISVSLLTSPGVVERNFTTNADNSKGFFPLPDNTVGVLLPLGPLEDDGSGIPVLPLVGGNPAINGGSDLVLRALDLAGESGSDDFRPNAGAVESVVAAPGGVVIQSMQLVSGNLEVSFEAPPASEWVIEGSANLQSFTPLETGVIGTGSVQVESLNLPAPTPTRYFIRFVPAP